MNLPFILQQLQHSAQVIHALAQVDDAQAYWKPDPASWSMVEVINHLYDEEREDFRAHLQGVLQTPAAPWSSIDPRAWVSQRRYQQRAFAPSLENFLRERAASLAWLAGQTAPDWQAAYDMPWGRLTAGDLLISWAAHDLLHVRQLNELRYHYLAQRSAPYSPQYAGEW